MIMKCIIIIIINDININDINDGIECINNDIIDSNEVMIIINNINDE